MSDDIKPSVTENWSETSRSVLGCAGVTFVIANYLHERNLCGRGGELKSKLFDLNGKGFQLGFFTRKNGYFYLRLHNMSDTEVILTADFALGVNGLGVREMILPYSRIEPKKYAECRGGNPDFNLTKDGSFEIKGRVYLLGAAVAVGKDGI